jgi:RAD51-like protein 2
MSSFSTNLTMPLAHLPLQPSTLARLQQRGFMSTKELEDSKRRGGMINVANELGVDINEAASLVREVESAMVHARGGDDNNNLVVGAAAAATTMPGRTLRTAAELFSQYHHHGNKQNNRSIITVCRSLDRLLGDGLPRAEVTEVVGMPGTGKTQLAMQLSVTTRLLASYGGVEGQAVYLDTEGSFAPERCHAMAEALVQHVQATLERRRQHHHLSQQSQPSQPNQNQHSSDRQHRNLTPLPDWWTSEYILRGIHVYRILDEAALHATLHALPKFFEEQEKEGHWPVRLVVIDSIAFPYRVSKQ